MKTLREWAGVVALVILAITSVLPSIGVNLGAAQANRFDNGYWDTGHGYRVDGVSVIDGSGNWVGPVAITSSSASLATTSTESFTTGGKSCTLTDANGGTYTLSAVELADCGTFTFAAGGAGQEVVALGSVATSALTSIPNAGDCKEYTYDASALAAGTTTTFTAATGFNLIAYTTNDDVIDGNEFSQWKMCRRTDTDVNWFVSELVHSD